MISPSGWEPEWDPDWFFVATEACGGGTPDLGSFRRFGYLLEYLALESRQEGSRGGHRPPSCGEGASACRLVTSLSTSWPSSSLQEFLYFPKIFSVNFQPIPRTFISAQKQHHGSSAENNVSPG